MLGGSLVTTAWCVLMLEIKETTSIYRRWLKIYWTCSRGQLTNCAPPAWRLCGWLTTHHCRKPTCYEMLHRASGLMCTCEHGNEHSCFINGGQFLDWETISFTIIILYIMYTLYIGYPIFAKTNKASYNFWGFVTLKLSEWWPISRHISFLHM
jgi:hypothetical protein